MYPQHKYNYKMLLKQHKMLVTLKQMLVVCYIDCEIEDLGGKLTLPPYVDPHIHLDYVFTARKQGATNGTGTLFEGIQRWSETKSDLTIE